MVDTVENPPFAEFVAGVARDWHAERDLFPGRPQTLAFGGGTPSRQPVDDLEKLIRLINPLGETSIEANPEDISADRCRAWRNAGVTRLSIGVQSFHEKSARKLGRLHSARQARAGVELAMAAGFRSVSIDLIFGIRGQSQAEWAADLAVITALDVPHVSLYGLSVEPNTSFARRGNHVATDDAWAEMYEMGNQVLRESGILRYEVSNFARPGHRCAHNEHYWRARPWAGLGPSAHGWRPTGERTVQATEVGAWLGGSPTEVESTTPENLFRELVWSTLRHVDGIDMARVRAITGVQVRCPDALRVAGRIVEDGFSIRLGETGWTVADAVADRLSQHTLAGARPIGGSYSHTLREADG